MIDITNKTFGRWTVKSFSHIFNTQQYWTAQCSCGTIKNVRASHLTSNGTLSCGCLMLENKYATTHGLSKTNTYRSWHGMLRRCRDIKDPDYGGRGITFDPRWDSFENFLADMGYCPEGLQIDRRDNNGNYNKTNCHWTTRKVNSRNRRTTRLVEYKGRLVSLIEASELSGIRYELLKSRIRNKVEDIFQEGRAPRRLTKI